MIVSVFGGGIEGDVSTLLNFILEEILNSGKRQVLLIPFARTSYDNQSEWHENWYSDFFANKQPNIKFLNANNESNIKLATDPMIYLAGGLDKLNLINKINSDNRLVSLINNTTHIVAESGGAMLLGAKSRIARPHQGFMDGLNILKDVIVEPHYFEQNRKDLLISEIAELKIKTGIGVDSNSGFRIDTSRPYSEGIPLGYKKIEIITNPNFEY